MYTLCGIEEADGGDRNVKHHSRLLTINSIQDCTGFCSALFVYLDYQMIISQGKTQMFILAWMLKKVCTFGPFWMSNFPSLMSMGRPS